MSKIIFELQQISKVWPKIASKECFLPFDASSTNANLNISLLFQNGVHHRGAAHHFSSNPPRLSGGLSRGLDDCYSLRPPPRDAATSMASKALLSSLGA